MQASRKAHLEPYNKLWAEQYMQACEALRLVFKEQLHSMHHIGSTAIIGIYAKPIIDILIIVYAINAVNSLNEQLEALGYLARGEYGIPGRRYFRKGSKVHHTHHLHVYELGHPEIRKNLIFRDYLNNYKQEAARYSELKQSLSKKFYDEVSKYTASKAPYIESVFEKIAQDSIASTYDPLLDRVELSPADPTWPEQAELEIKRISRSAPEGVILGMEHIGSTSIPGICAKPLLDILVGVASIEVGQALVSVMEGLGYVFWRDNPSADRMLFVRGMYPLGKCRTHQVHVVVYNDTLWREKCGFRDFLKNHPDKVLEYQKLKIRLADFYTYDREGYTFLKGNFIRQCLNKAQV